MNLPDYFLLQIVQAPKETTVSVEYTYSGHRVIPTDGSAHPNEALCLLPEDLTHMQEAVAKDEKK
jgi:hypothetical protein